MSGLDRRVLPIWAAAALGAALYFFLLGSYPLTDRDEGEYAGVVAAMQRSGDYVIPKLKSEKIPYLEKPILVFWLVAGSQKIFGANEFATRLPSAASALLLLAALGALTLRITKDPKTAAYATAFLALSPLFVLTARTCLTDMPLTLTTTLTLLLFFLATEEERSVGRRRLYYCLAWMALAVGFLDKGPVAPAVTIPAAAAYAFFQGRLKRTILESMLPAGLVIFLAVNLPWYGLAYHRLGDAFLQGFFGDQIFKRGSTALLGHGGGPFYYLPVLLAGMFPFSAAVVPGLWLALKGNGAARRKGKRSRRLLFLCALATILTIVVFSVASTKLPHYILPCFPFAAILAAAFCRGLYRKAAPSWPGQLFIWLLLVLGLGLAVAAWVIPFALPLIWDKLNPSEYALPFAAPRLYSLPILAGLSGAAIAVAALVQHRRRSVRGVVLSLCGGAFLLGIFGTLLGIKGVEILQGPAVRMLGELKSRSDANTIVASYGLWKPSFFFYLDRFVIRLYSKEQYPEHHEELKDMMRYNKPVVILSRTRLRPDFAGVPGFVEIKTYGGYLLGGNQLAAERLKSLPPDKGL